jgi:hypothetical protein
MAIAHRADVCGVLRGLTIFATPMGAAEFVRFVAEVADYAFRLRS